MQKKYDVVVIGSGLGGLTVANCLGRNGHSVLLAEQHNQFGGLATYFYRKKHLFDVSLHGFPVGMKKSLRKYWSQEIANHIVQLKGIRFDNPQFSLKTVFDSDDFKKILCEKFEVSRETADEFYAYLGAMNYYDRNDMTNRDLFEKFYPRRNDIWRLLMEPMTYANGSTLDEPAITYGIVFSNFMSKGVFTFEGGTDLMLKMMLEKLEENGVDCQKCLKAEKINIADGRISGVVLNGKEVKCKAVVSNGNLLTTVKDYIGIENFSTEFVSKIKDVKLNTSSSQVYIGLTPGEKIDYIGDLLFTSTCPEYSPEAILDKNITSRTFSVYYPSTRPDSPKDYTIVASMNSKYEDWEGLSDEDYKQKKKDMIEETLDALEKYLPEIRGKIDYLGAATPKTFKRYTLHEGGASFGTKFEGLEVSQGLSEEIPGAFHTGSVGIIMSGWLGAANYGAITAHFVDKYLSVVR
ncbi:MAG: FAD-dependent oxidoreductase [Verrucomicrobiota bacterium]|nr:FAD-dependent oxidoreductase [Verrucomicrobiota bacterium]